MLIEEELFQFLQNNTKNTKRKKRNVEIILYYLGFRDNLWPTLDEVAEKFKLGTRERIRQIVYENFKKPIREHQLKSVLETARIIKRHKYISINDLTKLLRKRKLISDNVNISAVLKLLHGAGLCEEYNIFTSDLKRTITRWIVCKNTDLFMARKEDAEALAKLIKKIKTMPGQTGVCRLDAVFNADESFQNYITQKQAAQIILNSKGAWHMKDDSGFWYILENRKNVLLNHLAKIYRVVETMEIDTLAEAIRNAMRARTNKYGYPTVEIISKYLRGSSYLEVKGNNAVFKGKRAKLNPIEEDIIEYLKDRKGVLYNNLKTHLRGKGYKEAYTVRCILHSAIVSVHRRKGKLGHLYSLAGNDHF